MPPDHFEIAGDRGYFRPTGVVSPAEAANIINDAILFARDQTVRTLLIDVTGLQGFGSPSIAERYFFIQRLVSTAAGARIRAAMVAPAELIDPDKFGVTVARNRGAVADVFASEAEAIAWLDSQ